MSSDAKSASATDNRQFPRDFCECFACDSKLGLEHRDQQIYLTYRIPGGSRTVNAKEDVEELCSPFGSLRDVRCTVKPQKVIAVVTFATTESAEAAVDKLHGTTFQGFAVTVELRSKHPRTAIPLCWTIPVKSRIWMGNLSEEVTSADIGDLCYAFGGNPRPTNVLKRNHPTTGAQGPAIYLQQQPDFRLCVERYILVDFDSAESAAAAIHCLDGELSPFPCSHSGCQGWSCLATSYR